MNGISLVKGMAWLVAVAFCVSPAGLSGPCRAESAGEGGVARIDLLPPGRGNPRNSEGDFIELRDGRVLFVYTHFTGGGGDHAGAHLAGRFSGDGGRTWTEEDTLIIPNEAEWNIMSVSLLRLDDGRIALFYIQKNSLSDSRPVMRTSADEAKTWSDPVEIIPDEHVGYYVLNNDRVVQTESGRLVVPVALHNRPGMEEPDWAGTVMCYLSDDGGRTWRRSEDQRIGRDADGGRVMVQEPGVVELKDGRLMMFCRTDAGTQYVAYSSDGGDRWSPLGPSNIHSPRSPASIERIPETGDLLLVWNDHREIDPELRGKRTPLTVAISRDEGETWRNVRTLEDNPHGWYCYTAIAFVEGHVLLGHAAGDRRENNGLAETRITRFPVDWLYR